MPIPVDRRRISHHQSLERRRRARREREAFTRRLSILLAALAGVVVLGTIAFVVTEGVSVAYAFVWTLDTVTTLGALKDPQDVGGRIVVVLLELFGIGTLFYGLATVAEFFVSGQLSGLREERRNQRMIDSYSDHFIICGFGRVGRQVARDLGLAGVKHVAIDADPSHREEAASLGVRYIESYAADDEVLMSAGIMRARAIIACVDSDADNIFISLTARELRPDMLIIARASAEDSEKKLRARRRRPRDLPVQDLGLQRWRGWRCTPRWAAPSRSPTTGWRRSTFRRRATAWARRSSRSAATRWSWRCVIPTGDWSPSRRRLQ